MCLSLLVSIAVFALYPQIDLQVAGFFFDPGRGFVGERDPVMQSLFKGVPLMSRAAVIALLIALFAYSMQRGSTGTRRRVQIAYLIVSLALGPGLLVNTVLKDNVGRARPVRITEFGGSRSFTPPLKRAAECDSNCSSLSEHAAAGFFLVSLGFLGNAAARRRWTLVGLFVGMVFGLARMTQGGHYLSDIVFSFYAVWFAAWLAWFVFRRFGRLEA
ncbi:phosphatase PAP2 family protein [Azoarcus sp. KH32C]|uniref:phosphatase PAP2 family protein n=1 Tax=Azoarcus sp. KH32C TaxID=748247 RepID=UPI0008709AEA|nr:phosphatase PAP2 family protein [Azoarcus sp. KH32C]